MHLSEYIELIIDRGYTLIKKLGIEKEYITKPLNIEDIAWHLTKDEVQVNPFTLYSFLQSDITSKEVYRKPYFGISGDSIPLLKSLALISRTISIPTLILGKYRADSTKNLFKMVDYGLIVSEDKYNIESIGNVKTISLFGLKLFYYKINNTIIFLTDNLNSVAVMLYIIRPLVSILYKMPFLLYPLEQITTEISSKVLYLNSEYNPVDNYNNLRYIGLKVESNLAILEDLYACPSS